VDEAGLQGINSMIFTHIDLETQQRNISRWASDKQPSLVHCSFCEMLTLSPGWNLVPRCRTIILPGMTSWPPNFLTPRRRPAESLPLRVEPPDFFVAQRTCINSVF
jgi:hypothetical protein